MTTIAQLGIEVNSADAAQAATDLDKLTDSGKKSEEAAKKTGRAWEQALSGMATDTQQIVRELQALNAKQDATAQMMATVGRSISGASSAFTSAAVAIDRYRSNSDALNAAQTKTADTAERAAKAAKSEADQLAALVGKIDPTVAALGRLDAMEKSLQGYRAKGLLDADSFRDYQAKIDQTRAGLTRFDDSLTRTGNTAKQTAAALRGVPAQFTDIAVSLQGGQAPLTVLLQQGGQLKDMFGGIAPAARALGGYILGLVNPFTVAAAAAATLGVAYYQGSREADAFSKSLITTGNAAGITADSLASMAKQVSATVGTTGAAAAVLAQLASNGRIASGSFDEITSAALTMQQATGKAVEETVAEFASLAKEPVAASIKLNEQYRYLTASVYEQIVALEKQGEQAAAVKLATDSFADAIQSRGDQITRKLGYIEGAWNKVAKAAKWAWDAALDVGREATFEDRMADLEKQANNARRLGTGPRGGGGRSLKDIEADKTSLLVAKQEEDARAQAAALQVERNEKAIKGQQLVNGLLDKAKTKAEQTAEAYKKIGDAVEANRKQGVLFTKEQIESAKRVEFERINGKPTQGAKAAPAVDLTGYNDAQNALKTIVSEYKNTQKELDAAQKAGLVSQEDYLLRRQALIGNERDELTKGYEAEISALESAKAKTSTSAAQRIQLDQKIADARTAMVKAQRDADTELEVLATNEQGRLAKQERSINAYVQALGQQQKALELAGQRAVLGVGRGDRQSALDGQLNSQQDRYAQQALELENQRSDPSRNMSTEEFERKAQALAEANKKATDQIRQNYADVQAAQGDWTNGATAAWENYLDSARDIAGQTKSLFGNAFSSMEDAVANFAITGKLSFSDFTKSILADMAKIAARQASSSAMSALFSLASSAASSYFGGSASSAGSTQAGYSSTYFPQADGGAWSNGVQMFANGAAFTNSIVSQPTAFGMANGKLGVMGEAGDEAVMPLTRTSNGQLGVKAIGGAGGGNTYNFPVAVSVQTSGDESGMNSGDMETMGRSLQTLAKTEAEQAISRSLKPGGKMWSVLNGR